MARKTDPAEYTFLSIRVDSHEVAVGESINLSLRANVPFDCDDEDPVFTPDIRIEIGGMCIYPEGRANAKFEITIYGDRTGRDHPKLKDIRALKQNGIPVYRKYRDRQIPVYERPPGLATVQKRRGENAWSTWFRVAPRVASDLLTVLKESRQLFVSIHERKLDRHRWVQGFSLQTTDPANE